MPGELLQQRLCGHCVINPAAFDSCTAVFLYEAPVSRLIAQFKYEANFAYGRVLATLLVGKFIKHYTVLTCSNYDPDFPQQLIPVPLHPRRLRTRGFNQANEIARTISKKTGIPVNNNLVFRTKDTAAQSQLGASKRIENLRYAFEMTQAAKEKYPEHVAIIDDVITTTSTVSAIARLLKSIGIRRVDVWALARATRNQ